MSIEDGDEMFRRNVRYRAAGSGDRDERPTELARTRVPGSRQSAEVTRASDSDPLIGLPHDELNFIFSVRQSHRDSIWEEQKHFTWLMSLILTGQIVLLTASRIAPSAKAGLVLTASVAGILFAITGYRVERIEGHYFSQANHEFLVAYQKRYPEAEIPHRHETVNKTIPILIWSICTGQAGVRDYFQFLMLCFVVIFAAVAVYSYILF
jgi:hypothetical protein